MVNSETQSTLGKEHIIKTNRTKYTIQKTKKCHQHESNQTQEVKPDAREWCVAAVSDMKSACCSLSSPVKSLVCNVIY